MKRSTDRILTTHVGALPEIEWLDVTAPDYPAKLEANIKDIVARQREIGLDIVNDGGFGNGGDWLSYMNDRLGGYEERQRSDGPPMILRGSDRAEFGDFYKHAFESGKLFYMPDMSKAPKHANWMCVGPITFEGMEITERQIALMKANADGNEAFLTTTAPASLEVYRENEYYPSAEEHVFAIADAMRNEYEAIASAGLILQVDDAWLLALWERIGVEMGLEDFRKFCEVRIEALNHALANVPEEQVRYHLCWGSWHGPHKHDLELSEFVDLSLKVKAQGYLIEAANARHEHEWTIWQDVKLPDGKILIPGVIAHSTDIIEHPELVSQRIQRFAGVVGRENVIAGADCGFGARTHPQIAWSKLQSLTEGAARASEALWG